MVINESSEKSAANSQLIKKEKVRLMIKRMALAVSAGSGTVIKAQPINKIGTTFTKSRLVTFPKSSKNR